MEVYDGLAYLRRYGTIIRIRKLEDIKGWVLPCGFPGTDFLIDIEENQEKVERIKTLIHEAIRFSPEFVRIPILNLYDQWESEIENLTQKVFASQPVLNKYLEQKIKEGRL